MTDHQIAAALVDVGQLEGRARAHFDASRDDVPERDAALVVLRHTTAAKRGLEQWIAARAMRAAIALRRA